MANLLPDPRADAIRMSWSRDNHDLEVHAGVDRAGQVERTGGHPWLGGVGRVGLHEVKAGHRIPVLRADHVRVLARADDVNGIRVVDQGESLDRKSTRLNSS